MKSVAKVFALTIFLIVLVNIVMQVIIINITKAKVVGMTGHVLESATEMSVAYLEDAVKGIALEDTGTTSVYTTGISDAYEEIFEVYFSQSFQSIDLSETKNQSFLGDSYDYMFSYNHTGSVDADTPLKSIDIYLDVEEMASGEVVISTVTYGECYFGSSFLRSVLGENTVASELVYYDTISYDIVEY